MKMLNLVRHLIFGLGKKVISVFVSKPNVILWYDVHVWFKLYLSFSLWYWFVNFFSRVVFCKLYCEKAS